MELGLIEKYPWYEHVGRGGVDGVDGAGDGSGTPGSPGEVSADDDASWAATSPAMVDIRYGVKWVMEGDRDNKRGAKVASQRSSICGDRRTQRQKDEREGPHSGQSDTNNDGKVCT